MSQDAGNFSVRRPRETLGAVSHNVSAIPMPASAMKRSTSNTNLQQAPHTTHHVRTTSGSRMSLAPNRPAQPVFQRSSSGENLAQMGGFSTVQRPSTANFLSTNAGRKSYAPVASTPANPIQLQESTQRRSSVYSHGQRQSASFGPAGHQSFFATAPPQNGMPTDPRRLKDGNTKNRMGQEIMEFLSHRSFEMEMKCDLTPKIVTSPTQKEFERMFQFIYRCIDPSYRFQKGIDYEGPAALKQLRYPFEKTISKTQWTAASSLTTWPTFLGMLHWMMQLTKMMEDYSTGAYNDACIEAGYDVTADRITFQFLSDAYKEWLSIEDDDDDDEEAKRRIEPHVRAMAAKFEEANESNLEQIKILEAESKALQDQIDELSKSAPKLAKLDEVMKTLEEDRVKFEQWNEKMEHKVEKFTNRATVLQQEIVKSDEEMREAEEERDELKRKVDDQGLTIAEIDRMNTDRTRLQKSAEATSARLEESKDKTSKKEAEAGAKLDELESTVQRYNSLGYQIDIIPPTALNAQGNDYELHLHINSGPDFTASQLNISQQHRLEESDRLLANPKSGYKPTDLLPQQETKDIKRNLQHLRNLISERRNAALEEDVAKLDMLDKTREALEDKASEMATLEHRLRAAREEYDKTKQITDAQGMNCDVQIERMEKDLARMRVELSDSVYSMEQREMSTNLEYEQLSLRSTALREELHTELERIMDYIIKFKIHIQKSLEEYEDFVAVEVEREWGEQQDGGQQLSDEIRSGDDEMEE